MDSEEPIEESALPDYTPKPFRCELTYAGDSARLAPSGDLDLATVPELDARLHEALSTRHRRLVVDLRGLDFIDSTGLSLLTRWSVGARRDGYELVIVPGIPRIMRLFELTGLYEEFDFADG